jgi:hypothetical protein
VKLTRFNSSLLYILIYISVSVALIGGHSEKEGNVYALNPSTGVFGPVCDDNWDLTAVIFVVQF